jgi:subtilisin family serine protease
MKLMSSHKKAYLPFASTCLSSIASSLLVLATGSAQAQEPLATIATIELLGAPMTMDAPAVSDLAERARSRGRVRVIASVATPPTLAPSDIDAAAISRLTGEVTSLAARLGAETAEPISGLPLAVLEVTEEQLQSLVEAGLIANVVEDVPEPPALADSVPLINADDAAALGADGNGQAIAILDTGVERNHAFFGGRVVAEACFSSNSTADGATTVCPGGATTSTAPGSAAPCGHPRCDHGTHVAGIAAGQDANRRGVAPAADLLAVQVFLAIH